MIEIEAPATVAPAPVETVTPIKPSEAIRLGCLISPVQAFEDYWETTDKGEAASCALGAMIDGYGHRYSDAARLGVSGAHGLIKGNTGCPETDCSGGATVAMIPHLNDDHRWSRERIADWLAEQGL